MLVNFVVNISKIIAAFSIAAGVLLAFINVVGRYIFESSFSWAGELTIYLFLWSVFFGSVYCFKKDAHIAVDLVVAKLSNRARKIFMIITYAISFVYVSAISYYGYKYVLLYIDLDEMSVDLDIPLWIPYVVVPISFAFSAIVLFDRIIKVIRTSADEIEIKDETKELLEELSVDDMVKAINKKTGGML